MKGLIAICCIVGFLHAEMKEACEVYYDGDPSELNDSNVIVPEEAVALAAKVVVDIPDDEVIKIGSAPSIFLVIDHSGSMFQQNYQRDRWGQRFSVAYALIDTLVNLFDSAEVGVAVFRRYLYYDPVDDPRFVPCVVHDTGAYIPLLKLDSSYAPSGEMGHEILQKYLEYDTVTTGNYDYVDLVYQPTNDFNSTNTNITCGFAAAKEAMKSARYSKNRQFVIFLSDGESNHPGGANSDAANKFLVDAQEGIPTTFTIYFTDLDTVPWSIDSLTKVIKGNGYSTINDSSKHFTIDLVQEDLMQFFEDNILDMIVGQVISSPVDITVNNSTVSNFTGGVFTFDNHFPLEGVTTTFEYDISYTIAKDSIIFDDNEIPIDTIVVQTDSATSGEFDITIEDGASLPTHYPNEFSLICWERELAFYYNGTQVNVVDETMEDLEVRFTYRPGEAEYEYTNVDAVISNVEGSKTDKETFDLSKENDSTFSYTFPRVIIVNQDPDQEDGTLQHLMPDSIVAVFRNKENPQLPLDTLRIAVPFRIKGTIVVQAGYYYDRNADGYVDSIVVKVTNDLDDGLTEEHLQEIMDLELIKLPDFRGFTVTDYHLVDDGFVLIVDESTSHDPVTYVTDEDSLVVSHKILSMGGWLEAGTVPIYDKVAPIIIYKKVNVIGENLWTPLLVDFQIDTIPDTLVVVFSEPIEEITKSVPFYFLDVANNVTYTADLNAVVYSDEQTVKFTVNSISNNVEYMSEGDSIWIHEGDCVGDICLNENSETVHNYQNNKDNIHRVLRVESVMIIVDLNPISISPLDISNINSNQMNIIPDDIITILEDQGILDNLNLDQNNNGDFIGMVIQVIPDDIDIESMKDLHLEGWLSIFDAVGNQLVSNEEMAFNKENKTLNWAWNGRNSYSRMVASAMYLVLIDIKKYPQYTKKPNSYLEEVKRLFVAVKD